MSFLDTPTVLVLGAGASSPYGFPLGLQLKQDLIGQTTNETTRRILVGLDFEESLINDFHDALQYGFHQTIDIFLERKSNFRELGSYLIAITIMPKEVHQSLFPQRDWYGDLFNALKFEELESPDASLLSVVTLNYDRSFEHFMRKNIDYNCRLECVEAAHAKREKIRVVHAHGSLGPYPAAGYGLNPRDQNSLKRAADSIKIVSDRLDDSPDFQKAQKIIREAEQIIFLGFGYNDVTLSALLGDTPFGEKNICGSAYKLDMPSRQAVMKCFESFGKEIRLGDGDADCSEYLRRRGLFNFQRA